jgi:hypothetical protein
MPGIGHAQVLEHPRRAICLLLAAARCRFSTSLVAAFERRGRGRQDRPGPGPDAVLVSLDVDAHLLLMAGGGGISWLLQWSAVPAAVQDLESPSPRVLILSPVAGLPSVG